MKFIAVIFICSLLDETCFDKHIPAIEFTSYENCMLASNYLAWQILDQNYKNQLLEKKIFTKNLCYEIKEKDKNKKQKKYRT